jgi:phosphoribosylformimino-5-aminoimidazole carboxamide ribotide isomerase
VTEWAVYPAIDLRRGQVVRLIQGDPQQQTAYANNPLDVARRWEAAGAQWVHVVNLDGALDEGGQENRVALGEIAGSGLHVQFGGGLRDFASLQEAFDVGVSRVVIGTAAVEQPELVVQAVQTWGSERVAVAIDTRQGTVRTHGWQQEGELGALQLAQRCAGLGVQWLIYTEISRDGMGTGLDVATARQIAAATGLQVIASGGVGQLEDVHRARRAGLAGVIVGRALYDGRISLNAALTVGEEDECWPRE